MGVTDEAIEKIKAMIVSGRLRPGDRLPPEPELASLLMVSRSSLREAVRALSLIQVLDVRQGDGTYVTSLEPAVLLEGTSFVVDLFPESMQVELYQVRRILEPAAAALAAARVDDDTVERLKQRLQDMEAATAISDLAETDLEFHRVFVGAAGNRLLASLIESLSGRTIRTRVWRFLTEKEVVEETKAEHRQIFEAIRARDPELAAAAAREHIARGEQWLRHELELGAMLSPAAPPATGQTRTTG